MADANLAVFEFVPPPEAAVFRPTAEEFVDPLAYIDKIRPIAEQTGICKIIPPKDWQPPFVVDIDNLKFTPRIQRLNELEAHTRVKLNFLEQIAKFWELQGSPLKIPLIESRVLDLYTLNREVSRLGGDHVLTTGRLWCKLAHRMGYLGAKNNVAFQLKQHYLRILQPFNVFNASKPKLIRQELERSQREKTDNDVKSGPSDNTTTIATTATVTTDNNNTQSDSVEVSVCTDDSSKSVTASAVKSDPAAAGAGETVPAASVTPMRRTSRMCAMSAANSDTSTSSLESPGSGSKELKRLLFYGAGPKMPGFQENTGAAVKPRPKKDSYDTDPLARYVCHRCERGDSEECMLLCDGCDDSYHTFCLTPPLPEIPKGDWRCPGCVAREVDKPLEPYGFEQAHKEYTLHTFGEMADQFKADFFCLPLHMIPCETVEREYWRIVSTMDEDVVVEYGADLHTMDHGSGFPTKDTKNLPAEDLHYTTSGWNLTNIAVQENSMLGHIRGNISGMKVPWLYVGMCFSTFCWHTEDHWSYSINYLHWGEPKTWYGCSGRRADQFEDAMRASAPDLFRAQPDLLHQLVTTMNPNTLMAAGVPIFRLDQHAGEFVLTFPRAYHAGFNQGFNLAEAVNFAPPDWMAVGRECVEHYSNLRRFCVFSHDELSCSMALQPDTLSLLVATATYHDLIKMVQLERNARAVLLQKGVRKAEREPFELLPDDERQCDFCKTTCFLSAVTCACSDGRRLVCPRHHDKLCQCPPEQHVLRFRYTMAELPDMLQRLKQRVETFDKWIVKVKNALLAVGDERLELEALRVLLHEARMSRFPESELLQSLSQIVDEASKCSMAAKQLTDQKVRTRTRQQGDSHFRLDMDELRQFSDHVTQLTCRVPEENKLNQLVSRVSEFHRRALLLLAPELPPSSSDIQNCIDLANQFDIELPELIKLKQRLQQSLWLEQVEEAVSVEAGGLAVARIHQLIDESTTLVPQAAVERARQQLQEMSTHAQLYEQRAEQALSAKPSLRLSELRSLLTEARHEILDLPNVSALQTAVDDAQQWCDTVDLFSGVKERPDLQLVQWLVARASVIPVLLPDVQRQQALVSGAVEWRQLAEKVFFKRSLCISLLEVLSPRADMNIYETRRRRKPNSSSSSSTAANTDSPPPLNSNTMALLIQQYNAAETKELEMMKNLRATNWQKRARAEHVQTDEDEETVVFCVCRRAACGFMLHCELCWDLFHLACVPPGVKLPIDRENPTQQQLQTARFMCPLCTRSRRPRLDSVLSLLLQLQKLGVRVPEGVALHCLTERVVRWQDRARAVLSSDALSAALVYLANTPPAQQQQQQQQQQQWGPAAVTNQPFNMAAQQHSSSSASSAVSDQKSRQMAPPESSDISPEAFNEHAYSAGGVREGVCETGSGGGSRRPRKSQLIPRRGVSPPPAAPAAVSSVSSASSSSCSSGATRAADRLLAGGWLERLQLLLLEADLMEVHIDEASQLWRLVVATRPALALDFTHRQMDKSVGDSRGAGTGPRKRRSHNSATDPSCSTSAAHKRLKVKVKPSSVSGGDNKRKPTTSTSVNVRRSKKSAPSSPATSVGGGDAATNRPRHSVTAPDQETHAEDCAASPCQKPHGTCINWIGCDRCEQWYHYVCVGLPKNYRVTDDMVYLCPQCQQHKGGRSAEGRQCEAGAGGCEVAMSDSRHAGQSARAAGTVADCDTVPRPSPLPACSASVRVKQEVQSG